MKPVKRIILSVVAAGILCQLSFMLMKYGIDRYDAHSKDRLNELLYRSTHYDMLFIGSSRTHLTVNPRIIDSVCHVNSYNAGIEGGNLFEFNMMLKAYLQNHPAPKWLVLTLDLNSFASDVDFFNYPQYFSFTKNKVIDQYLNQNGHSTWRLKLLPFLEITDYDDNTKGYFIKGLLGNSIIPKGDFEYKGYLSNTSNQISSALPQGPLKKAEISESRKKCLDDILKTCESKKINLVFTYAPEYMHMLSGTVTNSKELFDYMSTVAAQNSISFFRDDSLSICYDPTLFVNPGHLNRHGADVYSLILAEQLNKIIK